MKITMKDFPYDTNVVSHKYYDEHMKLYKGYVDRSNIIMEELAANADRGGANAAWSKFRGLQTGRTFCLDGVILHELFFQNIQNALNRSSAPKPLERARKLIDDSFGSFDNWLEDLTACGMAARGWVVLCYEQRTKTCANICQDAHDAGVITGAYPLLVLDMYEHAYFGDYGADKAKYISAFSENINWEAVESRAAKLRV